MLSLESSAACCALLRQFGCCLVGRTEHAPSIIQNISVATAWQPWVQHPHPVYEREREREMRGGGDKCLRQVQEGKRKTIRNDYGIMKEPQ